MTAFDDSQLDNILQALAQTKRRGIVHDLALGPSTVARLARDHKLSLPAIHKHIKALERASLLIRRKSGRTNFVALDTRGLHLAQSWIMQYHPAWGSDLASLENYIARMQE